MNQKVTHRQMVLIIMLLSITGTLLQPHTQAIFMQNSMPICVTYPLYWLCLRRCGCWVVCSGAFQIRICLNHL